MFWLSGDVGTTHLSEDGLSNTDGQQLALKLGYDVNPYVALYSGWSHVGALDIDDMNTVDMGVKLQLPINEDWSLYTTLGGYSALGSVTHQVRGNAGVGVNYQITPQFGTHLGVDYKNDVPTDTVDINTTSVVWGLTYRFGQPKFEDNVIGQVNVIQDEDTIR